MYTSRTGNERPQRGRSHTSSHYDYCHYVTSRQWSSLLRIYTKHACQNIRKMCCHTNDGLRKLNRKKNNPNAIMGRLLKRNTPIFPLVIKPTTQQKGVEKEQDPISITKTCKKVTKCPLVIKTLKMLQLLQYLKSQSFRLATNLYQ